MRPYLLEEAHEVAAALDRDDDAELGKELGDLLFQIVFLSSIAEESGSFAIADVIDGIHRKMVDRHPHVFDLGESGPGERADERLSSAGEVRQAWERRKARRDRPDGGSLLDGVTTSLPALVAAFRLTEKAGGVGFDWPDATAVLAKVEEEISELREEMSTPTHERLTEEVGDLLFTLANLARKLLVDPEAALARANLKFRRRFRAMEALLAERGEPLDGASLETLDALWDEVKERERSS